MIVAYVDIWFDTSLQQCRMKIKSFAFYTEELTQLQCMELKSMKRIQSLFYLNEHGGANYSFFKFYLINPGYCLIMRELAIEFSFLMNQSKTENYCQ